MYIGMELDSNINFNSNFEITKLSSEDVKILNNLGKDELEQLITEVITEIDKSTKLNDTILGALLKNAFTIQTESTNTTDQTTNQMSDQEKQMFNSAFTEYQGVQKGTTIKALESSVQTINSTMENKVQIQYNNGENETTIDPSKNYNVSFDYNDEGYISTINIVEQ
jgi:hypothetical protein